MFMLPFIFEPLTAGWLFLTIELPLQDIYCELLDFN